MLLQKYLQMFDLLTDSKAIGSDVVWLLSGLPCCIRWETCCVLGLFIVLNAGFLNSRLFMIDDPCQIDDVADNI